MPTESIIALSAIVAVFVFFGSVLSFADMTWDAGKVRSDGR